MWITFKLYVNLNVNCIHIVCKLHAYKWHSKYANYLNTQDHSLTDDNVKCFRRLLLVNIWYLSDPTLAVPDGAKLLRHCVFNLVNKRRSGRSEEQFKHRQSGWKWEADWDERVSISRKKQRCSRWKIIMTMATISWWQSWWRWRSWWQRSCPYIMVTIMVMMTIVSLCHGADHYYCY